jgi:HK97 gp10 family phage protein
LELKFRKFQMANPLKINLQLDGLNDLAPFLKSLKPSRQSRILGETMAKAGKPVANLAKQKAPKDTGALRRSITVVVRRYPQRGKVIALIGAAKGYYGKGSTGKLRRLGAKDSREGSRSPAYYSHLVEYGHRMAVSTGQDARTNKGKTFRKGTLQETGYVLARPFLRPAVVQGKPLADAEIAKGFALAIEHEHRNASRKFSRASKLKI